MPDSFLGPPGAASPKFVRFCGCSVAVSEENVPTLSGSPGRGRSGVKIGTSAPSRPDLPTNPPTGTPVPPGLVCLTRTHRFLPCTRHTKGPGSSDLCCARSRYAIQASSTSPSVLDLLLGDPALARLRVPSCPPRIASTDQKFSRQLVFSTAPLPCGNFKPKRVQKTFYKLNLPRSKVPTIFFCTGAQVTLIELNKDTREIRASKVSTIERETRTFFLHIDAVCAGYAQVTLS